MPSWRKVLNEMRAEARRKEQPEVPPLKGTFFEQDGKHFYTPAKKEVEELHKWQAVRILHGWALILSCAQYDGQPFWHLSASVNPYGRLTTDKDWKWLWTMAEYLGAPEETSSTMTTKPNGPHHWSWPREED